MAPFANRLREWIWAHPARARRIVAGLAVTAVAGGAFVGLRPGGDSADGRLRHRQYAGAVEGGGGSEENQADGPTDSTASGAGAASGRAPGTTGSAGTATTVAPTTAAGQPGAPGAAGIDGAGSSPATGGAKEPEPGTGTTADNRPSGASGGSPAPAEAGGPGWAVLPKAPIGPRTGHTAVWTGREMVIWGGTADFETDPFINGAAYDPAARAWRKLPDAPLSPRFDARAYWTGTEMLVFGGNSVDGDVLADGATWSPATNTWRAIPASPLGARDGSVIAWAGDRLVVWSGNTVAPPGATEDFQPELKADGAAYVPAGNRWVPVAAPPIPPRTGAQWAWTGSRLIVTGGEGEPDSRTDGAAFDPVSGTWAAIAARPQGASCGGEIACTGLWTGTGVLFPASAQAYDPAADRWSALAPAPGDKAPAPGEPSVWTGRQVLAWGVPGGEDDGSVSDADPGDGSLPVAAALYDPAANRWQTFAVGPLRGRTLHTAVWTGEAMLIWGGSEDVDVLGDGAAYRPE